jgi:SAM-dependent methyltransferase
MTDDDRRSTERFGDRAVAYAAFRPSYPDEAIDAVLEGLGDPSSLLIADIGSGTGISSRMFAERGATVIGIEPNAEMRNNARVPENVEFREGTGEATGLATGSIDIAVACQSFHWFATPAAMHEFRRIARLRAAMLQYERDERNAFTKAYGDCVRAHATDDTEQMRMRSLAVFSNFPSARVMRYAFTASQHLDLEEVIGRASSSSYLPNAGPESVALRRDLRKIFERHEDGGRVELSLVCFVITADWEE